MSMSFLASPQQSFLANALSSSTHKLKTKVPTCAHSTISCRYNQDHKDSLRKNENQLAKLAMVALTAGVLTLGSVSDASAAKSGGRVGGQAFPSAPKSAPRSPPRINNNSRTNIYINPRVAPPLVGGYGYGYGVPFFGGWGWSPFSFFAPGPSVAVGIGGGFDTLVLFMLLGAVAAVFRRFARSRDEDEDY
ncbi:uncharacterized protein LOC133782338 [Humulus lupulus]|uniref:uncharacterized protein LOC133782338 n=1 Tax=Humulus lupulus TaxID=3486 RepID=UPI002B412BA4|nr:uncharacterized protein LOC133782338 [Humulus lupulus]